MTELIWTLTAVGGFLSVVTLVAVRLHDASATVRKGLDLLLPPTDTFHVRLVEPPAGDRYGDVFMDDGR